MRLHQATLLVLSFAGAAHAQVYDIRRDWSDSLNPQIHWSLNAGAAPLPHVAAWQASLGGWSSPQPAWAFSSDGTDRLPVFFRSNGSENFAHDWLAGDIVVHSQDEFNGIGNGPARVVWFAYRDGTVTISGAAWPGRNIGRANHWTLYRDGVPISDGQLDGAGPYSRANPFSFSAGSGGAAAVQNIPVTNGTQITLEITRTSAPGDFVGIDLQIALTTPCYPNCDPGTTTQQPCLNVLDFACFLNKFAAGDPYANCDNSTSPPVLNVLDFGCFLNRFASGCSSC